MMRRRSGSGGSTSDCLGTTLPCQLHFWPLPGKRVHTQFSPPFPLYSDVFGRDSCILKCDALNFAAWYLTKQSFNTKLCKMCNMHLHALLNGYFYMCPF